MRRNDEIITELEMTKRKEGAGKTNDWRRLF
jgi:hypothetical protein